MNGLCITGIVFIVYHQCTQNVPGTLLPCRSNRRMFESFQLPALMQELLRTHANPDNSFLTLNLQSILLNLTSRH